MNKSFLEKLLDYYNLSYEDYLSLNKEYSLENFDDGHRFNLMNETVCFVKEKMKQNKTILVYGDYDADGIMGTSILVRMFMMLDYKVDYYVPSRYLDGYGINLNKAKEYVEKGIDLVITVDNGISAFDAISYLREHNVDVVILDHHTPGETLPNANYILHPIISNFGQIASSGAFVAFMFSRVMLNRSDKYLSTLASISLISDMMPLKEYNRNLLKTVFRNYQKGEFLSIDLLCDGEILDESVIGLKIAPKINSIGRMVEDTSINDLIIYFTSGDNNFVLNYINKINSTNDLRKNYTKSASENIQFDNSKNAIVIKTDLKEGLIGLLANSLLNTYKKPVIVFANSCEDGILKGSARSVEGLNIVDTFKKLDKYLSAYGGHALAGGCSLKEECFDDFCKEFYEICINMPLNSKLEKFVEISINDINKENYELVRSFSPFGEEFPSPNLMVKNIKTSSLHYSKNGEHIFTNIGLGKRIVGFNFSSNKMSQYNFVNIYGTLKLSTFNGYDNIDFSIKEIKENI